MAQRVSDQDSIPRIDPYDFHLQGHYGQFGAGADIQAFYLQTALPVGKLENIKLINEIPGSEHWSVRDLFQRDVDEERVLKEIKPFFESPANVKFFSPLTLTLLPLKPDGQVAKDMPRATEDTVSDRDGEWTHLTRQDLYRFKYRKGSPGFCQLDVNQSKACLVAIDGQHRLATLQLIRQDAQRGKVADFANWIIPIVVVSFRAASQEVDPPTVLQVVRQLFTNINSEARSVSEGRQILLNDTKPNAMACQELIQRSHENDFRPEHHRDLSIMPLLGYDWRSGSGDDERDAAPINHPGGLKSVQEIHAFFKEYILGEDYGEEQKDALCYYGHVPDDLFSAICEGPIPLNLSEEFREQLLRGLIPSVSHLIDNFTPYRKYIKKLRDYEGRSLAGPNGSIAQYAFHELRYGRYAEGVIREQVDQFKKRIQEEISSLKERHIPKLFERAIGMRAVMYVFGKMFHYFRDPIEDESWWVDYGESITKVINQIYKDGWFDLDDRDTSKFRLITHVAVNHDDRIIDFRHKDMRGSLGNYILLLSCTYALKSPSTWPNIESIVDWEKLFKDYEDRVVTGVKKQIRPIFKDRHPNIATSDLNRLISQKAKEEATSQAYLLCTELIAVTNKFSSINDDLGYEQRVKDLSDRE